MEVRLEAVKLCHIHAPRVAELVAKGRSLSQVAADLGISWLKAKEALDYARILGDSLGSDPTISAVTSDQETSHRPRHADEVLRLRDQESLTVAQIASRLSVSPNTVMRSYNWARREKSLDAIGKHPNSTNGSSVTPPRAIL